MDLNIEIIDDDPVVTSIYSIIYNSINKNETLDTNSIIKLTTRTMELVQKTIMDKGKGEYKNKELYDRINISPKSSC